MSNQLSNDVRRIEAIRNLASLEHQDKHLPQELETEPIELADALEQISKHIVKLQSFDFKQPRTHEGSSGPYSSRSSSSTREPSRQSDDDDDIPTLAGKQAKRLSRRLAKSKMNASQPDLTCHHQSCPESRERQISPAPLPQIPFSHSALSNRSKQSTRIKLFQVPTAVRGLIKRLLNGRTKKTAKRSANDRSTSDVDKTKSKSCEDLTHTTIVAKVSSIVNDKSTHLKSAQNSFGNSDMVTF